MPALEVHGHVLINEICGYTEHRSGVVRSCVVHAQPAGHPEGETVRVFRPGNGTTNGDTDLRARKGLPGVWGTYFVPSEVAPLQNLANSLEKKR